MVFDSSCPHTSASGLVILLGRKKHASSAADSLLHALSHISSDLALQRRTMSNLWHARMPEKVYVGVYKGKLPVTSHSFDEESTARHCVDGARRYHVGNWRIGIHAFMVRLGYSRMTN